MQKVVTHLLSMPRGGEEGFVADLGEEQSLRLCCCVPSHNLGSCKSDSAFWIHPAVNEELRLKTVERF